ncbi:phosphorylase [Phormidesmis priestleyi ULC007]|uniref:Phosphorylase n=1 Tax=Phormidesmis priestleyi ULC007 TaxID=1920490 RepID=A0A2T1DJF4_9CYAN|nr:phosphorylase [Phormidesmis priestleyi ULC007]PZO54272.1 MAG: phosphorylase [Phormidesmis priestleyi]
MQACFRLVALPIILHPLLTFLVPQGAEHRAICQGLKHLKNPPQVIPIPIGVEPVTQFLRNWQRSQSFDAALQSGVLVMGLCGSLTVQLGIGDRVLYQSCQDASGTVWDCDPTLTAQIQQSLQATNSLVRAFTSDRILSSAHEKQQLGQVHQADVVDMEGSAILTILAEAGVPVAMLRVVSDDTDHDLPDLSAAISPEGRIRSLPLAIGMIRQPIAALRLIRGSLTGLRTLEAIAARLG